MIVGYDENLRKHALLATSATCATIVFGLAFRRMMSFGVLPLFLAPVLMSAMLGSRRAGLIATAVSVPVAAYVFVPPTWSFAIQLDGVARLALFAIDAVLVSLLFGASSAARNPSPA